MLSLGGCLFQIQFTFILIFDSTTTIDHFQIDLNAINYSSTKRKWFFGEYLVPNAI